MNVDGERVRRLREAKVLSLSMLALKSGVSRETILAIEQEKRYPHPATIHKLADALGVDPEDLIKRDDDYWSHRLHSAGWCLHGRVNDPSGRGAIWGVIPLLGVENIRHEVYGSSPSDAIQRFLEGLRSGQYGKLDEESRRSPKTT